MAPPTPLVGALALDPFTFVNIHFLPKKSRHIQRQVLSGFRVTVHGVFRLYCCIGVLVFKCFRKCS